MNCPKCGAKIPTRGVRFIYPLRCSHCGWTRRTRAEPDHAAGEFAVSWSECIVCWILAIPAVLGPYAAIWWLRPSWASDAFLYRYYWIGWGVYLLLAFFLSPEPNPEDFTPVELDDLPTAFGGRDLWPMNSLRSWLALALAPGKIVLAALLGTPRHVIQILRLRAKNRALEREARRTIHRGL